MKLAPFHRSLISLNLLIFALPLAAQDDASLSNNQIKEIWGRVIFCERIYTLPEVKPRLYGFDLEQSDMANQQVQKLSSGYSQTARAKLKSEAEYHARGLSYNTSDPYHAVGACRDFFAKLTKDQQIINQP